MYKLSSLLGLSVTPVPGGSRSADGDNDSFQIWLIIVIVIAALLFILLLIIVAIVVRRKRKTAREQSLDIDETDGDNIRTLQPHTNIVGYDGPYAPNFHDIEVKFR